MAAKTSLRLQVRSLLAGCKIDALGKIYREARDGYLPRDLMAICYGIDYSLSTGRLPGRVDYEVRHLKPQQMGKLVCDLFDEGIALAGDVPRALIRRFANN
jgi:hypothetical protein